MSVQFGAEVPPVSRKAAPAHESAQLPRVHFEQRGLRIGNHVRGGKSGGNRLVRDVFEHELPLQDPGGRRFRDARRAPSSDRVLVPTCRRCRRV